jgi:molecular chaperone GrpE
MSMSADLPDEKDLNANHLAEVKAASDLILDPVAALTADLQRLQAEYVNYRKRVERDRALAHDLAIASLLQELISTLDDIDRASSHNELTGSFKAVADQLNATTKKFGLEKYGAEGDSFDPNLHEAVILETSVEVSYATASKILQQGFRHKSRILRPARVVVTEPIG